VWSLYWLAVGLEGKGRYYLLARLDSMMRLLFKVLGANYICRITAVVCVYHYGFIRIEILT
jgi:hypothetical protein